MITLFGFGPAFQLPDPSPFVMKMEVLLKLSGLPYRWERGAPPASPKGKVPWIDDDGIVIGDSTLIRLHLERAHGIDFDRGLMPEQRALAWSIERMLEDHLYFALLHARWMDDTNFAKGPANFFTGAPDGVREMARERTRAYLQGQGLGRHTDREIALLAAKDLAALSALIGNGPYLMGDEPCGADATAFAMIAGILTPYFDTPHRDAALAHPNLVAYRDRMMEQFYPAFAQEAA
jgi:glutathione S-transferase